MISWNSEAFRVWAVFDLEPIPPLVAETFTLDVCKMACSWPVNDKPICTMSIPLGRRGTSQQASPIHQLVDKLRNQQLVKVYLHAKTTGFVGFFANLGFDAWPTDPFVIFEGHTVGYGYRRSTTGVEYTIHLEHWIADLAHSSAISALSSPDNPASLIFNAININPSETAAGRGGFTGQTSAESFISASTVKSDFWGDALQKWLAALASMEELVRTSVPNQIDPTQMDQNLRDSVAGNRAALRAINRMEPRPEEDGYIQGVPLTFDEAIYNGELTLVAKQIASMASYETLEGVSGMTLWDKLIQYASNFLFAVVPLVESALVIPFVPGLRQEWKTILASEYDYCEVKGGMPCILRGVGIYGGAGYAAGSNLAGGEQVRYDLLGIGGYYPGATSGQIIFKAAPAWMARIPIDAASQITTGASGRPRSSTLFPAEGDISPIPEPSVASSRNSGLMNAYARMLYVNEVLKSRQGDLSGKLRFDIAPGSTIKIEGCGERFLGTSDQFGQSLWATVTQVDIVIDAETPKAGTSFHVSHFRSTFENSQPGTSIDRHTLWSTPWTGTELIQL